MGRLAQPWAVGNAGAAAVPSAAQGRKTGINEPWVALEDDTGHPFQRGKELQRDKPVVVDDAEGTIDRGDVLKGLEKCELVNGWQV